MNSRERVRKVINKQMPDRVPNGLGGCETAGLHLNAYKKLQNIFNIQNNTPRLGTFMANAVFEEDLILKMQGDTILLDSPNLCGAPLRWGKEQWKKTQIWDEDYMVAQAEVFVKDETGNYRWKNRDMFCPENSWYFDSKQTTDLMSEFTIPNPKDYVPQKAYLNDDYLRRLEENAKRLYNETELSLTMGESITDLQIQPGGFVGSMVLMIEEPEIMHELLEKSVDAALKQLILLNQAIGKYVDTLLIAQDLGDNRGIIMGANLWREIYKPHYKRLFSGWKQITDMKINMHSCGAISELIPDLIECGLDILNPIQLSAKGMKANELKSKFGKDIVFWGGAYDAQLFTVNKSYEEIYFVVSNNIKILKKGGNYIFSGVHNLPADLPETHIKAMLDAWCDNKEY